MLQDGYKLSSGMKAIRFEEINLTYKGLNAPIGPISLLFRRLGIGNPKYCIWRCLSNCPIKK